MLRKKQLITQQNNSVTPKVTSQQIVQNSNAKVTVQYIQEQQQLIQKPENANNHMINEHTTSQDDLEIEYLDENPTAEEFIEGPIEKTEFEDTFYPNAIHCLLDFYKDKYESLSLDDVGNVKVTQVWHDIAKDMQESYFEFNEEQVRHKYILLREQYFGVQSREDIEKFDYFDQLHDIYKDRAKENILKGLIGKETSTICSKDEALLTHMPIENNDFKSEEIVHKEHEFIDMVEKELQALEESKETINSSDEIINQHDMKENNVQIECLSSTKSKRNCIHDETTDEPPTRKAKPNEYFEIKEISQSSLEEATSNANNELSLFQYNEQQERRHREKMDLLAKSLNLQKLAIEQQNQLLQELIKRLPIS